MPGSLPLPSRAICKEHLLGQYNQQIFSSYTQGEKEKFAQLSCRTQVLLLHNFASDH